MAPLTERILGSFDEMNYGRRKDEHATPRSTDNCLLKLYLHTWYGANVGEKRTERPRWDGSRGVSTYFGSISTKTTNIVPRVDKIIHYLLFSAKNFSSHPFQSAIISLRITHRSSS